MEDLVIFGEGTVFTAVCLFVSFFVNRITRKFIGRFS